MIGRLFIAMAGSEAQMFHGLSDLEQEKIKELINQLLGVNFLRKEVDRDKYLLAKRHKDALESYFKFLGWNFVLDDRNECIAVISPKADHRRHLKRDESIFLLVLRLLYQEKRQSLSLSDHPLITLHDIRSKYETFRLPFVKQTLLKQMVSMFKRYQLIDSLSTDVTSDDSKFHLFHTLLHAIDNKQLSTVEEMLKRYNFEEGETLDEVDEEAKID
ncbi:DUF4194 domain-containing protein [Tumebacillus lipolyticus]|uniref:DUF4194 domain-containing protein n=1 Tax=Tumebacillus lipolyticus TaxID=1280370 RepID=A0ABW5A396_9BACL